MHTHIEDMCVFCVCVCVCVYVYTIYNRIEYVCISFRAEESGNMCRERSQAKIMATLKTHILSGQFKLLRSKEGHLIF